MKASLSGKTIEIKGVADPVEPRDAVQPAVSKMVYLLLLKIQSMKQLLQKQVLPLAGGTLTGTFQMLSLSRAQEIRGYAFEAKLAMNTTALIRSVGTASFNGELLIALWLTLKDLSNLKVD